MTMNRTAENAGTKSTSSPMTYVLWIVQVILALLFLFSGIAKLVLIPSAALAAQTHLPGLFMKFVGFAELMGGLGLILPGILRIQTGLTPLAAACLAIITVGATVVTLQTAPPIVAIFPFITCVLCIFVAYGRWNMSPLQSRS